MTTHRARYGPHNPHETYIAHEFPEQLVDLEDVEVGLMNGKTCSSVDVFCTVHSGDPR